MVSDHMVTMISAGRSRTRAGINANALRAAEGMRQLGVMQGDTVALLLRNDFAFFEASTAATALGASPVAINWHLAPQEVRYVLEDCGASVMVAHADLLALLGDALPPGLTVLGLDTPDEIVAAYRLDPALGRLPEGVTRWEDWLEGFPPLDEICTDFSETMTYTSGTTGKPKGVRRFRQPPDEAARYLRLRDALYDIRPGIRALICGPLYHGAPNAFGLRAMTAAEQVVLMPRFEPEDFLAYVQDHRITHVFMVPTMFVRLLKLPAEVRDRYDVSSLDDVLTAAAHCPAEVKRAMLDWFGPIVHEFLAGTESSYISYCSPADALRKPGTVGRLVEGATVRFIDEQGADVPPGEPGEIYTHLSFAPDFTYANREADRAALDLDGLIGTGDVGYLDADGYLFLCDRRRDMVISGGVNIYPAEIEAELLGIDAVSDCAVFGIPDPEYGEKLMAVIEPAPGAAHDGAAIMAQLRTRLAGYKVPRIIAFRSDLPRDDAGKLYKRRIRDDYAQATPAVTA